MTLMTAADLNVMLADQRAAKRYNLDVYDPQAWAHECVAEKIERFKRGSMMEGEHCHTATLADHVTRLARSLGYTTTSTPEGTGVRVVIAVPSKERP